MATYFITFRTYGTWLHGDMEGSVDDRHNRPGDPMLPHNPRRMDYAHGLLKHAPFELCPEMRRIVEESIRGVCDHRRWTLLAINARQMHVHVVVVADAKPEKVMNDFKAYATRALRAAGRATPDSRVWAEHGSTKWCFDATSTARAIHYTLHEQ